MRTSTKTNGWLTEYNGKPVLRIRDLPPASDVRPTQLMCINIKGCNGSGKSTVPLYMINAETNMCYLTMEQNETAPVAVYCRDFETVLVGRYDTDCGGCDTLGNTQVVKRVLSRLWKKDTHIIFEGVIVGDIRSTFYEIMKEFKTVHNRGLGFCFMGTKYKECLRRIQRRNGGKAINEELVRQKYINSTKHLKYYLEQGDVECKVLKTDCTRQDMFERFLALYPQLNPLF